MLNYKIKTLLLIINKFIHDLFSGIWIGTIVAIYLLDKKAAPSLGTLLWSELHDVMRVFFWLGIFSIAVIFITGVFWVINYMPEYSGEAERDKKRLLVVKHVLLGAVFLGGTYLAYSYTFR